MTTSNCPTSSQLAGLLNGTLAEAEQSSLATHLEGCTRCQRELERLAAGALTWALTDARLELRRAEQE